MLSFYCLDTDEKMICEICGGPSKRHRPHCPVPAHEAAYKKVGYYGRPTIICLCGSTRFSQAFQDANMRQTLQGKIVLSIGCDLRSDEELFRAMSQDELAETKRMLDELHLRKIDMADEVLILNVGGYIGESTSRELAYAERQGKRVMYLEEPE